MFQGPNPKIFPNPQKIYKQNHKCVPIVDKRKYSSTYVKATFDTFHVDVYYIRLYKVNSVCNSIANKKIF